jgi:dipeptidyl aminopeptidase/acylaminoacyl peptidase
VTFNAPTACVAVRPDTPMKWSSPLLKEIALLACGAISLLSVQSAIAVEAVAPGEDRIHWETGPGGSRPITIDDIVSQRNVQSPRLSPDGSRMAYVVSQAFRDCNCHRYALYLTDVAGKAAPVKLIERDLISNIQWLPDGLSISYFSVGEKSADLMRIDLATRATVRVLKSENEDTSQAGFFRRPIGDYRWSHDGRFIAFVESETAAPAVRDEMMRRGFLYDDTLMWSLDLSNKDWDRYRGSVALKIYSVQSKETRVLWRTPQVFRPNIGSLAWSPDDRTIAVVTTTLAAGIYQDVATIDAATGEFHSLDHSPTNKGGPSWAPDGRSLVYISSPGFGAATAQLYDFQAARGRQIAGELSASSSGAGIAWDGSGQTLYFSARGIIGNHLANRGIYAISPSGGPAARISPLALKMNDCDMPRQYTIACVVQSPSQSPKPGTIDVRTHTVVTLTDVNPEFQGIKLAPVSELHWKNSLGAETNGYLVVPSTQARRVPLVIMAYGFDGDFVTHASMIDTNYPAQVLAQSGMAVLLFNDPGIQALRDFHHTALSYGRSPLASIRSIVNSLAREGVIDPARVGYAGHSFGGFLVEYALEHSNLIQTAELHNGGTNVDPNVYTTIGNIQWRTAMNAGMGGPPWGASLKNYVKLSAVLNADKIRAPVLMEYDDTEALEALDMFGALRQADVAVESYVYPGDTHVFDQPDHVYWSMQRNVDWFRFWLQNYEDPESAKREQYQRWRELRHSQCQKPRSAASIYCKSEP